MNHTHANDFEVGWQLFLPHHHEWVWQIEAEEDDPAGGRGHVGLGEERGHEEAEGDGAQRVAQHEDEGHAGVRLSQDVTIGEDEGEQEGGEGHHAEAVDEPGQPMDGVAQAHGAHSLLQPLLLFVDDALNDHGGRVDPGQRHEERKGARDGDDEPVLDVARVGHLLQRDPRQRRLVASALSRYNRVLQHIL